MNDFLAGGGDLGARMRAIDWSKTALGPVASWPQSLKTCVRVVLTSRQPMFVWWGEQLINIYNDAYKSIVGGKHPWALGQPANQVWREIWDQVGPRAEQAMRKNEGTYDEALLLIMERNGYPEETYYTFSYSPVPNDDGGNGGILCANSDDTQRIISERQLTTLRELGASTSGTQATHDSATAAAEVCRAAASSLSRHARDLPFVMLYLFDESGRRMSLAASAGIDRGHPAAPQSLETNLQSVWPVEALRTGDAPLVFDALATRFDALPSGAWPRPPHRAVALPLPGGAAGNAGVMIVGLNPFRLFDEAYQGFLKLAAGQVGASIAQAQAFAEQQRRAEALAELDRAKTQFFSNVSHEFRTPLTLMLGHTESAIEADRPLEGEALASVHRNELRLLKLVNTLLDFSRIEAGRMGATFVPTDLAALTRELASAFDSLLQRAGLTLEIDCPPVAEEAFVDPDLWEKIVLNLVSNAFKFTFEGKVRVAVHRRGEAFELEVTDTGTGIPQGELARLFDRFHRVDGARARSYEGSGIGLALVRELVSLHGGTLGVDSVEGRGTTFKVSVPRGSAHLPAEKVSTRRAAAPDVTPRAGPFVGEAERWLGTQTPARAARPQAAGGGARVLVADDNADMRDYVTRLLEQQGWQVQAVSDGYQALEAAKAAPPDLVITDVMMPGLDGYRLLRALRTAPQTSSIPVVMLSARAGEEAKVGGLAVGANDYLVKPFSARELVARVQNQLLSAQVQKADQAYRAQLNQLFTHAPIAIAVLRGPNHVFELANDAYLQLIGRRPVVGKPILEGLPELEGQGIVELLDGVLQTGRAHVGTEVPVQIDRTGTGAAQQCYYTFTYQPLPGAEGRTEGVVAVAVDVTSHVEARGQLQAARHDAEAANRAKDEFLAMLGHELRNPLAPISTALQVMALKSDGSGEKQRAIIKRQVDHLVRLVDDLLDISRITTGRVELKRSAIELHEVLARAIEMSSPLLEERRHSLTVTVPRTGLTVDADPTRLAQVIANLLTNAAKYTEPEGRITVTASREDGTVVLTVRDSGIGITAEMLPKVFDLFTQERQAIDRSRGGLGLGLAIVKSLVAMHGGSITAHSEGRGRGSAFTLRLPIVGAAASAAHGAQPIATRSHRAGRRVLVVDDNIDAAEALSELITEMGYTTRVAHDGPSALTAAAEFHPEVAVLDLGLPVMDGYELARRLKQLPSTPPARLIAVTGYGQEKDRQRAAEAGFDVHLVKPATIEQVERALTG